MGIPDSKPWPGARFYLIIFLTSLLLRVWFFSLMYSGVDSTKWQSLSPDIVHYSKSAEAIAAGFNFDTYGVKTFGPGYPVFLAVIQTLSDHSPVIMLLLQLGLSSLVTVLLALLAYRITGDARVALLTGLLNAVSITAISLANIFLSETFFVALTAIGLLLSLRSFERRSLLLACLSGLCLGAAVLTRSIGVAFPLVVLVFAALGDRQKLPARLRLSFVGIGAAVLTTVLGLSLTLDGKTVVAGAFPSAMARIIRAVDAREMQISIVEATKRFENQCSGLADSAKVDYYDAYRTLAKQRFAQLLAEKPFAVFRVFVGNINYNMHNEFSMMRVQLPSIDPIYNKYRIWSEKKGLNYRVSLFALVGAVILLVRRQWQVCLPLVLIFGYFSVMSGFSDLQTSRIFYPAQIAWGILVSVALLAMYDWVMKRWSGRGQRLTG